MDQHHRPSLGHAQLDALDVQTNLQVRLVPWEVGSEDDLGLAVAQ